MKEQWISLILTSGMLSALYPMASSERNTVKHRLNKWTARWTTVAVLPGLWSAAQSQGGGQLLVEYPKGQYWGQYSSVPSLMMGQNAPSAGSQTIQNQEEQLIYQKTMLPLRGPQQAGKMGQGESHGAQLREIQSPTPGRNKPGINDGGQPAQKQLSREGSQKPV